MFNGLAQRVAGQKRDVPARRQVRVVAGQVGGVAAEVAQRTGVFGALGGLAGQLFGGTASKAAANAALDVMVDDDLPGQAAAKGAYLMEKLKVLFRSDPRPVVPRRAAVRGRD